MITATDMSWRVALLALDVELEHEYAVIMTYTVIICCRVVK